MSQLYVVSGPTAVGKGTLVKAIKNRYPQIYVSISVTTRQPRKTEKNGVDYFFIDDQQFDSLILENGLLEWAEIHGKTRYGTPKAEVESALNKGKTVLLEIDVQGALQVKERYPKAQLVFIKPPSFSVLLERITLRGTESQAQIARRMETAKWEMTQMDKFDYQIENDVLEETIESLVDLFGLQVSNH